MDYVENEENFTIPRREAAAAVEREGLEAGRTMDGSHVRSAVALDAKRDLSHFTERWEAHIRDGSFGRLPALWSGIKRLPRFRRLNVGVWRAIVAVEDDMAFAILFSRAPHPTMGRDVLEQAVARMRKSVEAHKAEDPQASADV